MASKLGKNKPVGKAQDHVIDGWDDKGKKDITKDGKNDKALKSTPDKADTNKYSKDPKSGTKPVTGKDDPKDTKSNPATSKSDKITNKSTDQALKKGDVKNDSKLNSVDTKQNSTAKSGIKVDDTSKTGQTKTNTDKDKQSGKENTKVDDKNKTDQNKVNLKDQDKKQISKVDNKKDDKLKDPKNDTSKPTPKQTGSTVTKDTKDKKGSDTKSDKKDEFKSTGVKPGDNKNKSSSDDKNDKKITEKATDKKDDGKNKDEKSTGAKPGTKPAEVTKDTKASNSKTGTVDPKAGLNESDKAKADKTTIKPSNIPANKPIDPKNKMDVGKAKGQTSRGDDKKDFGKAQDTQLGKQGIDAKDNKTAKDLKGGNSSYDSNLKGKTDNNKLYKDDKKPDIPSTGNIGGGKITGNDRSIPTTPPSRDGKSKPRTPPRTDARGSERGKFDTTRKDASGLQKNDKIGTNQRNANQKASSQMNSQSTSKDLKARKDDNMHRNNEKGVTGRERRLDSSPEKNQKGSSKNGDYDRYARSKNARSPDKNARDRSPDKKVGAKQKDRSRSRDAFNPYGRVDKKEEEKYNDDWWKDNIKSTRRPIVEGCKPTEKNLKPGESQKMVETY